MIADGERGYPCSHQDGVDERLPMASPLNCWYGFPLLKIKMYSGFPELTT